MAGNTRRRTWVVGATGGMGSAIALERARRGDALVLAGRDNPRLSKVAERIGSEHATPDVLAADLGELDSCAKCVRGAIELMGGLDTLISCSGVHVNARTQDASLPDWDHMLDVNFRSFVHFVHAGISQINASGHGAVIAIGSITSAYPGAGMHLAAKRALTGFCEALFEDVREFGTKVSVIQPGFVATPMSTSPRLASDLMIQPSDIADAVSFGLQAAPTACPTEIVIRPQRSPYR